MWNSSSSELTILLSYETHRTTISQLHSQWNNPPPVCRLVMPGLCFFCSTTPPPLHTLTSERGLRGRPAVKRGRGRPHLSFAEASLSSLEPRRSWMWSVAGAKRPPRAGAGSLFCLWMVAARGEMVWCTLRGLHRGLDDQVVWELK
jgi:hypothetical protein